MILNNTQNQRGQIAQKTKRRAFKRLFATRSTKRYIYKAVSASWNQIAAFIEKTRKPVVGSIIFASLKSFRCELLEREEAVLMLSRARHIEWVKQERARDEGVKIWSFNRVFSVRDIRPREIRIGYDTDLIDIGKTSEHFGKSRVKIMLTKAGQKFRDVRAESGQLGHVLNASL